MRRRQWSLRLGGEPPSFWLGLLATLAAVAASTLIVYLLKPVSPVVSLGVVYLPAILAISIFWGLRLGLFASLASVVAFNFFHIPPLHRLTIGSDQNWVALAIFAIVAVGSSALAGLARAQALEAERRREDADRALTELAALSRERDRMQEEMVEAEALRRSDELKTALLRSISHDLRTPLTSIIAGGAALGSATLTDTEREELSAAIVGEGERLSRLVENLLDMSRLEAGKAEPHREQTDLGEVLDVAREAVVQPGMVTLALDPELPTVSADAAQLERAFANLLENAIRHGGGRPVTVRSRLVGEKIAIRVVDQGPGIPESEWARIFEPFQSGAENGAGEGSGLGLAIARGFVEANGGEIAVESVVGQGSSFVVGFPCGEQAAT
jgi:two-component system sensor histidine kinase KdpD